MPPLSIEALQLFFAIVLPGFIAIKMFGLFYPEEKRSFSDLVVDAVAYGLINFMFWGWLLLAMHEEKLYETRPVVFWLGSIWVCVAFPALMAVGLVWLRRQRWLVDFLNIDSPIKTAWDFFVFQKQPCYILFHLKDGKKVGGFFGPKSYASTFPQKPEVYVEQVWHVNEEAQLCQKVEGTKPAQGGSGTLPAPKAPDNQQQKGK